MSEPTAVEVLTAVHVALTEHGVPHAFGGAFALQWCTAEPRGTIDVDLNILLGPAQVERVLNALPAMVEVTDEARLALIRDGQARLFAGITPLDLFFNTTSFHATLEELVEYHQVFGHRIPFLRCDDLCVFKAFFNRRKDWADIEEMLKAGTVEVNYVVGVLEAHLGADDERITTLRTIEAEVDASAC